MNKTKATLLIIACVLCSIYACKDDDGTTTPDTPTEPTFDAIKAKFANTIDLENLENYANQSIPAYITKDNMGSNVITDKGATLGRVLFYDKMLSIDNSISCASCHNQNLAFGDDARASVGVDGTTGRHSMRLVNARFSDEVRFFWDERSASLEDQSTMPIQDHIEMGYSGENGDPSFNDLIAKLSEQGYYTEFFQWVYGDSEITEERMQYALAQFVRSIQSFDSKYDAGRSAAPNDGAPFSNFTQDENAGKQLFLGRPVFDADGVRTAGGAGCAGCHRPPEFDIDPNSRNNGIIGTIAGTGLDRTNTKSPTLRDVLGTTRRVNGQLMHSGNFGAIQGVLSHYNNITTPNPQLDPRLNPGGNPQQLNLTVDERRQLLVFIETLTGSDVYTNKKWSNPFE